MAKLIRTRAAAAIARRWKAMDEGDKALVYAAEASASRILGDTIIQGAGGRVYRP